MFIFLDLRTDLHMTLAFSFQMVKSGNVGVFIYFDIEF